MTGLTPEQIDALLQPLDPRRVRQMQGNSHLEAWDVRRHLLRVFGWGGFDIDLLNVECILERSFWSEKPNEQFKGRHTVAYRVTMRLTIKDPGGVEVAHFEDGATGDAQNQPSLADAHDMALKTACSQALKRCAINLGDRYGLSLYNKGSGGAVVAGTLGNTHTEQDHQATEDVQGGELDDTTAEHDEPEQNAGEAASTSAARDEGGEGVVGPPTDPPAPSAPVPTELGEERAMIGALQDALSPAKRKLLRAWAVAHGHRITTSGGLDVEGLADTNATAAVLEHLSELQAA